VGAVTDDLGRTIGIALGARIRELRVARGLSQEELARRLGSHRELVGRVERGVHQVGIETVNAYARALGVDAFEVALVLDDVVDVSIGPLSGRTHQRADVLAAGRVLPTPTRETEVRRLLSAWARPRQRRTLECGHEAPVALGRPPRACEACREAAE
jgi:transcriptional regulator with XRE-family HTH domain